MVNGAPSKVSNKPLTVLCIVGIIACLVIPTGNAKLEDSGSIPILSVMSNATLIILTALVSIALFFEWMHHKLSHGTAEVFMPVLNALMGELMGIGFLAIIFYFLVKFSVLDNISKATVCQSCDPCNGGTCVASLVNDTGSLSHGKNYGRRLQDSTWVTNLPETHEEMKWDTYGKSFIRRLGAAPVARATANGAKCSFNAAKKIFESSATRRLTVEERHAAAWGPDWKTNPNIPGRHLAAAGGTGGSYTCECYHCDKMILHLFEDVHMGLFLVLVLFFIRAVMLLKQVNSMGEHWRSMEAQIMTIQDGENQVIKNYYEGKKKMMGVDMEEFMHFTLLRMRFLRTAAGGKPLTDDFSFAEYLNIIFGHTASHIVHIPVRAWLILEGFFVLFWAAMHSQPFLRARVFTLFIFVAAAVSAQIYKKYKLILDQLTMPYPKRDDPANKGKSIYKEQIENEPGFADGKPPYLQRDGKHNSTQHDALFWGGKPGPERMMHAIRLLQIIMLIFIVLLGFALPFTYKSDQAFFPIVVICVPIVLAGSYVLPQALLQLHCLTTSIELQKNPHAIEDTIRKVKFAKSIRTIALLRSLQGFAELEQMKQEDAPGTEAAPEDTKEVEEDDPKGKASTKEVFDVFDADGSGEIAIDEMRSLLASMGMELTQGDLQIIIKKFDTGGDGTISFEEFWQYMKSRKAKINPEEVVTQVFAMIDNDGSGNITAEEFSDTLRKLPTDISEDDINALVREIDSGGDGEISLHEFAHVLNKYI